MLLSLTVQMRAHKWARPRAPFRTRAYVIVFVCVYVVCCAGVRLCVCVCVCIAVYVKLTCNHCGRACIVQRSRTCGGGGSGCGLAGFGQSESEPGKINSQPASRINYSPAKSGRYGWRFHRYGCFTSAGRWFWSGRRWPLSSRK